MIHRSPNRRFRYSQTCTIRWGIRFIKSVGWDSRVIRQDVFESI